MEIGELVDARRFTLRKEEKLRHKQLLDALFGAEGSSLYSYPLRMQYRAVSREELQRSFRDKLPSRIGPMQLMISVPKRKMRHAVDRVYLRRRIREAYRLHRLPVKALVESREDLRTVSLSFVYTGDEKCEYAKIEKSMKVLLGRLNQALTPRTDS